MEIYQKKPLDLELKDFDQFEILQEEDDISAFDEKNIKTKRITKLVKYL